MEYNQRRDQFGELQPKKPKNAFSEKFAIPVIPDSVQQKRLKYRQTCKHENWYKKQTDNTHWVKICLDENCKMLFESEVVEKDFDKKEIML